MMRTHSGGSRYLVLDDVLPNKAIADLHHAHHDAPLRPALSAIDPFHDGLCFTAPGPEGTIGSAVETCVDQHLQSLAATAAVKVAELVGVRPDCEAWKYSTAYSAYPAGTKLSWHDDGADRIGAFIYYLDHWSSEWGGELDLVDCSPDAIEHNGTLAQSITSAPYNLTSIIPRDNRLVVLRSPTLHRIRRVDQLAGTAVRLTISGFLTVDKEAPRKDMP